MRICLFALTYIYPRADHPAARAALRAEQKGTTLGTECAFPGMHDVLPVREKGREKGTEKGREKGREKEREGGGGEGVMVSVGCIALNGIDLI